jgi:hypothetical protein
MNTGSAIELLRRGRPLAARLVPQQSGFLAWVGVYPLDLAKPSTATVLLRLGTTMVRSNWPVFRVRVSEDGLHSRADLVVFGEEALMQELDRLGVPRGALELPYKVNYPI